MVSGGEAIMRSLFVLVMLALFVFGTGLAYILNDVWQQKVIDPWRYGDPSKGWWQNVTTTLGFYIFELIMCFFTAALAVGVFFNLINVFTGSLFGGALAIYGVGGKETPGVSGLRPLGYMAIPIVFLGTAMAALVVNYVVYNIPLIVYIAIVSSFAIKLIRDMIYAFFGFGGG